MFGRSRQRTRENDDRMRQRGHKQLRPLTRKDENGTAGRVQNSSSHAGMVGLLDGKQHRVWSGNFKKVDGMTTEELLKWIDSHLANVLSTIAKNAAFYFVMSGDAKERNEIFNAAIDHIKENYAAEHFLKAFITEDGELCLRYDYSTPSVQVVCDEKGASELVSTEQLNKVVGNSDRFVYCLIIILGTILTMVFMGFLLYQHIQNVDKLQSP